MGIAMQGNWTVRVKSKNAAFAQRYQIVGTTTADGTYSGATSTPAVFAAGVQWSINIQNQPTGGAWRDSRQRIGFPTVSGGLLQFDIRSDDAGGDEDFNDLVLTCSMPVSASDFVVYGHVETYAGRCIFNPCFLPGSLVIDTQVALAKAARMDGLHDILEKLYPTAVELRPRIPIPDPPPDFRPIVIDTGLESPSAGMEFRSRVLSRDIEADVATADTGRKSAKAPNADAVELSAIDRLGATVRPMVAASLSGSNLDRANQLVLAGIVDKVRFLNLCETDSAPGVVLRFLEYDRTGSEKLGGPYTGSGNRQALGVAITDEVGNYLFRFSPSLADFVAEASDVGPGETFAVQIRPDLLVQALGTGLVVDFESAPYYNIPNLRRIDLCLPRSHVNPQGACDSADRIIQHIGDVLVLHAALGGSPNTLDSTGRITARNANAPQVDCAGWRGSLWLRACFGQAAVIQYTVSYRRIGIDGSFLPVSEAHYLDHYPFFISGGTYVGPFTRSVHVGGGPAISAPVYDNHDGDSAWLGNDLKVKLSSGIYRPLEQPGPVDFRIEGYDAAGNRVSGAVDTIRLYVHNQSVILGRPFNSKGDIASITIGGASLGDCGLFDLPSPAAPVSIRYRAVDPAGFVQSWGFSVIRGNNHPVAIHVASGVQPKQFPPATANPCDFQGTRDEPTADLDDYVTTTLAPDLASWLPAGVTYCSFAFVLSQSDRVTDGRIGGTYPTVVRWEDLVGLNDAS